MAHKLYDVTVVTGTYTKDGEQKSRYENVGSVWQGDNGQYMVMKRTFNPAGVPFKEGSDSIFLSMFEPKDGQQQQQVPQRQKSAARPQQRTDDSDVPF